MESILHKIVQYKCDELAHLKRRVSLKDVQLKAADSEPARSFLENFSKQEINIIAEIKKASPSAGVICDPFKPLDIARAYEEGGARALSILTDEHFFLGSLDILKQVKKQTMLPCLRKDFTLDEYHLYEARGAGADAVLLIGAILDDHQLNDYVHLARELGMVVLVEVHTEAELNRALIAKPHIMGVNNRNLETFKVDLQTSLDLISQIPDSMMAISESGFSMHQEIKQLREAGFDGFLIGETLLRSKDPKKELECLIGS